MSTNTPLGKNFRINPETQALEKYCPACAKNEADSRLPKDPDQGWWPLDTEFFYRKNPGFQSQCKACMCLGVKKSLAKARGRKK